MAIPITVHWQTNDLISAFHACQIMLENRWTGDSAKATALQESSTALRDALLEDGLPVEFLWEHLLPLASRINSLHQVTAVAFTKMIGVRSANTAATRYAGLLADVKRAFQTAVPEAHAVAAAGMEKLKRAWDLHGPGLLNGLMTCTEPGILVEEAAVAVVFPAAGGDGGAHLPYNMVWIEGVAEDPVAGLPEIVRLTWLLAMLNLDLPRFSESIARDRLPMVAAWAAVPLAVTAAASVELVPAADEEIIGRAVTAWLGSEAKPAYLPRVMDWWEAYRMNRPIFSTALRALDLLLD